VLDRLMKSHGGFEHNRQALRAVDTLENKYPNFAGLNLSHEIREAVLKYGPGEENVCCDGFQLGLLPFLEARIVNISDRIAYQHHDLDDGLKANILQEDDLAQTGLWREASDHVRRIRPDLPLRIRQLQVVNKVVKILISDLIEHSHNAIEPFDGKDAVAMRKIKKDVMGFSSETAVRVDELQKFLNEKFYDHHRLARVRKRAELNLKKLFHVYLDNIKMLPEDFRKISEKDGPERAVCDYIAGMTDRYALDEWKRYTT